MSWISHSEVSFHFFKNENGVAHIVAFMQDYKFSIAFENSSYPGYTTEKILHAMLANTVPIYWGNPQVAKDFNPNSFINCHDFKDLDSVVDYIKKVDQNDDLYRQYLAEPFFKNNEVPLHLQETTIVNWFKNIFEQKDYVPIAQTWKGQYGKLKKMVSKPFGTILPYSPFLPFPPYRYYKLKQWIGEYKYAKYVASTANKIGTTVKSVVG